MNEWIRYGQIKNLVNEYWELKDYEKYNEFILRLTKILEI